MLHSLALFEGRAIMPEGVKVGDAYIDVDARMDMRRLNRTIAQNFNRLGRESATNFSREFTRSLRSQKIRVTVELDRASLKKVQSEIAAMQPTVKTKVDVDRGVMRAVTNRIHTDVDRDSHLWARTIGRNFRTGVEAAMSLLPARLEALFTRTGPVVGTAFVAAFAASVAIALPAVGAMISGIFFASLGFGAAIAAAVVGAVNDPRVNKAVERLKDKF